MSDLFVSTIFVFAVYCAWACAVYQPKHPAATVEPEAQINYFPEVDETEEETAPEPMPILIVERRPVSAFTAPKAPAVDYSTMSIRELKQEAKSRTGKPNAVKGYSRLTRQQLITALSAS